MLPYASEEDFYWTGYYTSRATLKSLVRYGSDILHSSNFVFAQKVLDPKATDSEIQEVLDTKFKIFDAMGILQHHDAVAGTST
jgi:hypothetical protein